MTVGRIVMTLVGAAILGLVAGLLTRNIIIAIAFPFLLIAFLLMWRNLKEIAPEKKEKPEEKENEPVQEQVQPQQTQQQQPQTQQNPQASVSTNYPGEKPPLR